MSIPALYELKNVKTFQGMDTPGFNASLYADGKRVAMIIDDGNGGCLDFRWEGKTAEDRATNEQNYKLFVDALPPEAMPADAEDWMKSLYVDGFRKIDADEYIGQLVDKFEYNKKLARFQKDNVLFTLPGQAEGSFYKMKHNGKVEAVKAHILKKYPDAVFI